MFKLRTCFCTPEDVQRIVPESVVEERVETTDAKCSIAEMRLKLLTHAFLDNIDDFLVGEDSINLRTSENARLFVASFIKLIN